MTTMIEGHVEAWAIGSNCGNSILSLSLSNAAGFPDDAVARLSGRRVRVFIAALPEPEPRCPFCGGVIALAHFDDKQPSHLALCKCGAHGSGATREAALIALAEWLRSCPRCMGEAEYVQAEDRGWLVRCKSPLCKIGLMGPSFAAKSSAALWWNKRQGAQ